MLSHTMLKVIFQSHWPEVNAAQDLLCYGLGWKSAYHFLELIFQVFIYSCIVFFQRKKSDIIPLMIIPQINLSVLIVSTLLMHIVLLNRSMLNVLWRQKAISGLLEQDCENTLAGIILLMFLQCKLIVWIRQTKLAVVITIFKMYCADLLWQGTL